MDINTIKKTILDFIKTYFNRTVIWSRIKEAMGLPYAKIYIFVLPIFFIIIFLILTFPYEMYIRDKLKNLEGKIFRTIYISEMDFSLFDITTMNNIYIVLNSGSEINIKFADLDIALNPITLLMRKDIKGSIGINGFKYESAESEVTFNLSGNIYLDFVSFSKFPAEGSIKIIIENARLKLGELPLPGNMGNIQLQPISIKSIMLDSSLNSKKINIAKAAISGNDLKGNISGSITVSRNFLNSPIDLRIAVDSESAVLKDYKDFLVKYIDASNNLVIPVRGSLANPRLDLNQISPDTGEGSSPPLTSEKEPADALLPSVPE